MTDRPALLDTSVLIAPENGRTLNAADMPKETALSVVTLAELHAGVLAASDTAVRARRLATLDDAARVSVLPIDNSIARIWAELRVRLLEHARRAKVNDLWIAATAAANGLDVVAQDDDFDAIEAVDGPRVIRV